MIKQYITLQEAKPVSGTALVTGVTQLPDIRPPEPIIIPGYAEELAGPLPIMIPEPRRSLAELIRLGATYHDQASPGAFVEKVTMGYYAYERREVWRTCALAAAYAGAFGPASIERPQFSYSEAVFMLNGRLGYHLYTEVTDPVGGRGRLVDRIIKLTDDHKWTREGVAQWVEEIEAGLFSRAGQNWPALVP
jgi:hypothetical protein